MSTINKKILGHLAELARLRLDEKETNIFLEDLQKILDHFKELQGLDTERVKPMTGGTTLKNVYRADEIDLDRKLKSVNDAGRIIEAFPDSEKGFLKIPPVFE